MSFKEKLAAGERTPVFAIARMAHPLIVEAAALAGGYRGFWIDQEHGAFHADQILMLTTAARAHGMDTFVRMAPTGYSAVAQCLEAGAGGVMAAQIHSAEEAEQFVQWAKFAPRGMRGVNSSGYDARYTTRPLADFVREANDESFVAIQIETLGALEQAAPIAAIDGVDLLFVGPADLSMSLGVPGQFHDDTLWQAIEKVSQACHSAGKAWGCVAPDARFAERAMELQCRMPSIGNDAAMLVRGARQFRSGFEAAFA